MWKVYTEKYHHTHFDNFSSTNLQEDAFGKINVCPQDSLQQTKAKSTLNPLN
jgi:hypothetical protein